MSNRQVFCYFSIFVQQSLFLDSSTDQEFNDFVGSTVTNQNGDLFGGLEIELGIFGWDILFLFLLNQKAIIIHTIMHINIIDM